jgi:c-di-GMP-binding flagellar brake protein YcgR
MSASESEHRLYPRIPARYAVLVRCVDPPVEGFARTSDLSIGGCGVLTDEPIPANAHVEMLITVAHQIVRVTGRTVYSQERDDGRREIGVEFLDVAYEDVELIERIFTSKV